MNRAMRRKLPNLTKLGLICLGLSLVSGVPLPVMAEFYFDRGEPDDHRHPNVGWISAFNADGNRLGGSCSGTLIAPKVFLTASHCTISIHDDRVGNPAHSGFQVKVGFTEDFILPGAHISSISDQSLVYDAERVHSNPDYDYYWMSPDPQRADIAVVVLEEEAEIPLASLPYEGELSDLKRASAIRKLTFPAVGYGSVDVVIPPWHGSYPSNWFGYSQGRYVGYTRFRALHPGYMILSMNHSTGDSGPCYGDSGGPIFIGDSDIIAAITVAGDVMCRAMTAPLRLDTQGARDFLSQFVDDGLILP